MSVMRKRTAWMLGPLAALALLLIACGDGDAGDSGDGETSAEDTSAEGTSTGDTSPEGSPEASGESEAAGGCEMYAGETVTWVVPYTPGGGYDSYSRMIAPYLAEQLGATVVVENEPGAGGLLAINNLTTAEPDGTRIAIMNAVGVGGASIAGAEGVQFELDQLSYLGRVGASGHIWATGATNDIESYEDALNKEGLTIGSTGVGAADYVNANLLIEIFGIDGRVVTGFPGSEENELAVTSGEVDTMTGDFDSRIPAIENGDHRPILLLASERDDQIPDTPALFELDLTEEQLALAEPLVQLLEFGRPVVAPPNVPEDRLACLRDALQAAIEDPELVEQSETQGRPINWLSGADVEALTQDLQNAPEMFQEQLRTAYGTG